MTAPRPRISVVLPAYGVRDYLSGCLDSVLSQAGEDLEVIAVDDASLDGSGEILDAAAARDARIRVVHLARSAGPGNARNVGLQQAAGDYVWFIDGDDLAAGGAITAIMERLAADVPDVLLIDYENLYPDGRSEPSHGAALLRAAPHGTFTLAQQPPLIQLTMTSWSKVFRREFLLGLGVAFPAGIHEDVPVTCAALLAARRISALDRVCYRYRRFRRGSFMVTTSSEHFAIFAAYRQALDAASREQADAELRTALFERAIWHYTTVLQTGGAGMGPVGHGGLVPRWDRRRFFERMHADFVRYVPPGYQFPPGARGAKFRLIARDAYWTYELLEPLNRARIMLRRLRPGRPPVASGSGATARRA
jgi:CDP-glycerol glycerophosphotransferase